MNCTTAELNFEGDKTSKGDVEGRSGDQGRSKYITQGQENN